MKLAIDAMGGDHAPKAIIEGVEKATAQFKELHITLIGNESEIKKYLTNSDRISIIHTEETIDATDEPVRAVRRKKQASMVLMANEVAEGRADARCDRRPDGYADEGQAVRLRWCSSVA